MVSLALNTSRIASYTHSVSSFALSRGTVLKPYSSIGMYYETSFEAEVVERTRHCQVWGYDYRSTSFGSNKLNNYRAHFFPYGLANIDAHGPHDEHKSYTLKTLMEINSTV